MVYEGIAVHKRQNETFRYQIIIPFENNQRWIGLPIRAVNTYGHKTEQLPEDYIAVHPPDRIYEIPELLMAA